MIHIQGMGWFGAITALALERVGVQFTWDDAEVPYQAWRASTGIVYPAGDDRTEENRHRWLRWCVEGWLPAGSARIVKYVYAHKKPPHDGTYQTAPWWGFDHLTVAAAPAVAVNARSIVLEARSRFAEQRRSYGRPGDPHIIAHGHARAAGWVWGWSRKVALRLPVDRDDVAFYGKRHRFDLTYAYPVPDEPGWWWAGSALVNEKRPRVRAQPDLDTEWHRWLEAQAALFRVFDVIKVKPIEQGWRPKPAAGDEGQLLMDESGTTPTLTFPALWHSGVRWAPTLVEQATAWAASFR